MTPADSNAAATNAAATNDAVERLRIVGAGVLITPFAATDAEMLSALGDDPSVARMMTSIRIPFTPERAAARIARAPWRGRAGFLAAIRLPDGTPIGEVGVGPGPEPSINYFLGMGYRGRGLGRAAAEALLDWAFARLAPPALLAESYLDNPASIRLLEGLGFVATGDDADEHPLRTGPARYRCYRLARVDWRRV